jgi:hypothetical protein
MIKVKFNVYRQLNEDFAEVVTNVLAGMHARSEVHVNGFDIVPVQVSLEDGNEGTVLKIEGYIK